MLRGRYRTILANITSKKATTQQLSFKDAINTYKANDDVKPTELVMARDARMSKIGQYKTRRGLDRYSVPLGEAIDVQNISTTGASIASVGGTDAIAQPLTIAGTARITRVDLNLQTTANSSGTILVELRQDSSGQPGGLLSTSSIRSADVAASPAYLSCYFVNAPLVTAADVIWVVVKGQNSSSGTYSITTTTAATNALTSSDGGNTWAATSFSANVKLYTSTNAGLKGVFRAYRSNGQKETIIWAGSSAYKVNDTTGATTLITSGLNPAATDYRARLVQDTVYWSDGVGKPWKYDFTTASVVSSAPYNAVLIEEHKGILFYVDVDDPTRLFYTNFALYDTFTSTDFIYVPAPKSFDKIVALHKLNGVLYPFASNNKFALYGSDNATFSLDEATSQRGTFSQESSVADANFIYHADADGVWQFNGAEDRNLAAAFLEDYKAIGDKSRIVLNIFNNRLYIFYPSAGSAVNDSCFVYNLQLDKYESDDQNAFIGRTFSRDDQDNLFIQGSNVVGAVYKAELDSNDYHNLGAPMEYELRTSYTHFGSPAQRKRIPKWRPVFTSQGSYTAQIGYAKDFRDSSAVFQDVNLSGGNATYDSGELYDSGVTFGGASIVEPKLFVPGVFKRIQRRYKHVAAREPVEFLSEVLTIEEQRII